MSGLYPDTQGNSDRETVGRPMEILLVEDSLVDARLTIGSLQQGGFQHRVTLVRDGAEALAFLRKEAHFSRAPTPDLILLDLLLPYKNGVEVLEEIRADSALQAIPVVVLTASETEEHKGKCQAMGVESYITKPVNFTKFLDVVRQLKRHWLEKDIDLPV